MQRSWCDVCRGDNSDGDLFRCSKCPRKFHPECVKLQFQPDTGWQCESCSGAKAPDKGTKKHIREMKARTQALRKTHRQLRASRQVFFAASRAKLLPFVSEPRLDRILSQLPSVADAVRSLDIGIEEKFIHGTLRDYQVVGVNWILSQYAQGVGGILADEMGLGKTIQTLAFLASLKFKRQLNGPHLIITPLAVLQNWVNELKRFTPGLTHCKIQGCKQERDRILSDPEVLHGAFDIYLTTYETMMSEEGFFTDNFLWHTVTIDEGHRIKNEATKLCSTLARIQSPFRLLLTGTPLQNNMHELYALLSYILPDVFTDASVFEAGYSEVDGGRAVDGKILQSARILLESLMIRRIKADVENTLLPKLEYKVYVPLAPLQRRWYRRMLCKDAQASGLLSINQIRAKLSQLTKVCNHPKQLLIALDKRREQAASKLKAAEGSDFAHLQARLPLAPSSRCFE
ncbi:hypothetical protein CYMTET_11985, partial [Cymbomonas tetramitiformis]